MGKNNKEECRCSNKVETKNLRTAKCGAFLFEKNSNRIIILCRNCSQKYAIDFPEGTEISVKKLVESNIKIPIKMKGNYHGS